MTHSLESTWRALDNCEIITCSVAAHTLLLIVFQRQDEGVRIVGQNLCMHVVPFLMQVYLLRIQDGWLLSDLV